METDTLTAGVLLSSTPSISGPGSATERSCYYCYMRYFLLNYFSKKALYKYTLLVGLTAVSLH